MVGKMNRRSFIRTAGASIAAVTVGAAWAGRAAAEEKLTPDDPTAQALQYVEDASTVDAAEVPSYQAGRICGNCQLYQMASEVEGFAPCGAFGNKLVAHGGWCAAWTAKAA